MNDFGNLIQFQSCKNTGCHISMGIAAKNEKKQQNISHGETYKQVSAGNKFKLMGNV